MHRPATNIKKIHFIHHFMLPGGVERQLYYLVNGLAASHQVTLMLCEPKGAFLDFIDHGVSVLDLQTPYRHRLQLRLLLRMVKVLKREHPDVLISFHGKFHWLAVIAGALTGIKTLCVFPGYIARGLLWRAHRAFFHRADGLLAVSCSVRNSLIENLQISGERISVIENAIDTSKILDMSAEELTPVEHDYFERGAVIVSIGRLAKGKGFDDLVAAMRGVEKECTVIILGDGPERGHLEELIGKSGLDGRVFLLGNQVNPYKFLKRGAFFVLASESEGLPTVVLEAMWLGVPCICTRYRGGTEGVISHGETGYLVERNDPEGLAEAIDFFLSPESGPMKEAMVKAGKALVQEKFCISRYVAHYNRYLEQLTDHR